MIVLTHRGLDPDQAPYFKEGSREAFVDQLARGFGLEFDIQFTKDNEIIVSHDTDISRFSNGERAEKIFDQTLDSLLILEYENCHLVSLAELMKIIEKSTHNTIHAIHVKHYHQTPERLKILISKLTDADPSAFFLFDLTIEAARYIKKIAPHIQCAPSIAHPFDITRYNSTVGNTLMLTEKALAHQDLFSWVWLDEWDRKNENGGDKKLYTQETLTKLRNAGFKIALVTPELHATSPALLGSESHEDAESKDKLIARIKEITALKPDAVCTDHPDLTSSIN